MSRNRFVTGLRLPGISKVALSYGLEYDLPLPALGSAGGAYFAFDGSYRSKFSSNPSRSAYTDVSGYALANFRAGARFGDGWNVYGWVRNAFDKNFFEFLSTQSGNTGLVIAQLGDPCTYGLTVNRSF
jgi:iron complex outermembrane receptor protein